MEYIEFANRRLVLDAIRNSTMPADIIVDQGSTSSEEQRFLTELVQESRNFPGPMVEIGTLFGFTTNVLALAKDPERLLITVDSFSWNPWGLSSVEHRRLTERILYVSTELLNVQLVVSDKDNFYRSYKGGAAPCLVFLDAIHTYEETQKDIKWAKSAGCRLIAGHDYGLEFPGVIKAVKEAGNPEVRGTVWAIN